MKSFAIATALFLLCSSCLSKEEAYNKDLSTTDEGCLLIDFEGIPPTLRDSAFIRVYCPDTACQYVSIGMEEMYKREWTEFITDITNPDLDLSRLFQVGGDTVEIGFSKASIAKYFPPDHPEMTCRLVLRYGKNSSVSHTKKSEPFPLKSPAESKH